MKKKLAMLIALLLAASMLFAGVTAENRQKIYPVDSDVYEAIKYLYISQGLALPSTTGPWSGAELDLMLSRIDAESLSPSAMKTYEFVAEELGKEARLNPDENFGLDVGLKISTEMFLHSNPKEFSSLDDFGGKGDWRAATPLLSVPLETWIGRNVYGYSSFDLGINRTLTNGLSDSNFFSNIFMLPPSVMGDLNLNFPLRGFGTIGGDSWYISVGRDKLSWGPGESGNLLVGDQIPYHNNARFSAFSNHFKYTFSLSSFIHPMNYTNVNDPNESISATNPAFIKNSWSQNDTRDGTSMFIAHRLEWRIIDKINMALTEAIMYQSETNQLDLLVLSPTVIFHNYYIRHNANSLLSFEIDYTPIDYLNIYGEAIIDEFMLPGENGSAKMGPPSAFGVIGGVKTSIPLGNGMLYGSIEGAYTDPYLYLRDGGDKGNDGLYGINFVVAIPEFWADGGNYTFDFLGYRYGNDSVVANLNVGYKVFGSWFVDGRYTYIADGVFDMHTRWRYVENGSSTDDPNAPTSSTGDKLNGSYDENSNQDFRNAVAHWNVLAIKGGVTLFDNLDIWGEFDYIHIGNWQNIKGQKSQDVQFTLGVSYYI